LPALLLLNQNLYKWRTTSIVWCVEFHQQGVFIGVPGKYMVISYIYSICWCMKSVFYEHQHQSRDELIMEIAKEYGLNCMGENDDIEMSMMTTRGTPSHPPAPATPAALPEEIVKEEALVEMVPEQEALVVHEVILVDAEPELPQPRHFNMVMRDYEESSLRMENGPHELDDLDDPTEADYDVDEWFPEDGSSD
jgi:hypothetical protein